MDKFLLPFRKGRSLNTLFTCTVFIAFHYALVIYINSSFLEKFFSEGQVSALYIIGSVLDTFFLLNASKILEKIGVYRFIINAIFIEFCATAGMAFAGNQFFAGLFFLTHLITISLLLFNMDMLIENVSGEEETVGGVRATYLTLTNITIVLAPALISVLVFDSNYSYAYIASALFIIPLYHFMERFKKTAVAKIHHIRVKETIAVYIKNKDLYNIFTSQFLLQLFYSYMVVYTPIYLSKYIGFSWSEIGLIFTIMLIPFVIFELPVGELEDWKYGEKEFLTIGFIIMGLSTLFMSFITAKVFWIWATVLFITRVGASFVEISTDTYFFKHVDKNKTNLISFYRISRPLSFIVGPLLATLSLQFIPFQYIFLIIGAMMILGTRYSLALKDTK